MQEPDFIPIVQLSQLTGFAPGSLYNQHSSGVGPVAPILTKLGHRVGAWRQDYQQWVVSQRRLSPQQDAAGQ